jgi:putative zinc finger protein
MDCDATSERLPWLLNGSLEPEEAQQVRAHLAACAQCRAEMEETRSAAALFAAHAPTAAILQMAWDRPMEGLEPALVRNHLDGCPACQEELALARESRRLESGRPEGGTRRRSRAWPLMLPATLAAGLVVGVWWGGRDREPPAAGSPSDPARIGALEREVSQLRSAAARLESAARQARAPRLNLPIFEVLPGRVLRGDGEGEARQVVVPAGATEVALLLSTDGPAGTRAALSIEDNKGLEVWHGDGLISGPPGGYVVTLPVELLPDGRYVLKVRPQRGAASVYRIRVRGATR